MKKITDQNEMHDETYVDWSVLLELCKEFMCILDLEGRMLQISASWKFFLGCQDEECLLRKLDELVHPDERKDFSEELTTFRTHKELCTFVNRFQDKKREFRRIEWLAKIQDNRIYFIARDETDKYELNYKYLKSEYLLNEAQTVAELGTYRLDFSTEIWESTKILDDIFGIDRTFVKTIHNWRLILHEDHREMMWDYLKDHVVRKKNSFDKEYKIRKHNTGETLWGLW
jgi:PAS domain S-box-containing protein